MASGQNLPDLDSDITNMSIKNSINVVVQYCQKRKCDFNEIEQKDVAVYNNSQSYTYIRDQGNVHPKQHVYIYSACHMHN